MKNPLRFLSHSGKKTTTEQSDTAAPEPEKAPEEPLVFHSEASRTFPTWAQFRYAPRLMSKKERILLYVALAVVVVMVPAIAVRWYVQATELGPDYGGSYTEALVGAPKYVNPLLSSLSDTDSDLTRLIYSGLFTTTDEQELVPDLVTNYALSEDKLTYTFFLRHNVKWHDGEPFDADDVVFTVRAIQDPLYHSPLQAALQGVETKKLDDHTVSMTLPEQYAPFLSILTFGIMPEHLWYDVPANNIAFTELNITPVGTGPFKFDRLVKEKTGNIKEFHMVRNDEYYGDLPYLDELHFLFYPDSISAVEALKSKKVEGTAFFPASERKEIEKKNSNIVINTLRIPQYTAIFFNQKESDVLADDDVRKALAYSVDRENIIERALYGQGEPIDAPILPGYLGYNPDIRVYDYKLQKSKQMLVDAGWEWTDEAKKNNKILEERRAQQAEYQAEPSGVVDAANIDAGALNVSAAEEGDEGSAEASEDKTADGNEGTAAEEETLEYMPREQDGVPLEFTIATVDLPEYRTTLALLQEGWEEVGIKANIDFYSPEDIQNEVIKDRNYEALLFGEIVGTDPDPYPFWHSSQQKHPGLALSIFRDTEVDQLLEEARKTTNEDERKQKYIHFQNNIVEDVQALFLYNPHYLYAVHEKIEGVNPVQYISVPSDRFARVTQWYVKTKRRWKDNGDDEEQAEEQAEDQPAEQGGEQAEE